MGRVLCLEGEARDDAHARYVARFPEGAGFVAKLDFRVYALAPEHVRLIGGFGRIAWLEPGALVQDPARDPLAQASAGIIAHMNDDHREVLGLYCAAFRHREGIQPTMTSVDAYGFDLRDPASGERFRFDFPERVTEAEQVRKHVVSMAREARQKLGIAPKG